MGCDIRLTENECNWFNELLMPSDDTDKIRICTCRALLILSCEDCILEIKKHYETCYSRNTNTFHPAHYNAHPSGVECITIVEGFNFNIGNVIKYAWRAGLKSENPIEDLQKAKQCIEFEISRITGVRKTC